jgi:hypothetical protein
VGVRSTVSHRLLHTSCKAGVRAIRPIRATLILASSEVGMAGPRKLTHVERESIINGVRSQRIANWSAHRGGQPGLELTDDGAEHAGSEQPRPEWT